MGRILLSQSPDDALLTQCTQPLTNEGFEEETLTICSTEARARRPDVERRTREDIGVYVMTDGPFFSIEWNLKKKKRTMPMPLCVYINMYLCWNMISCHRYIHTQTYIPTDTHAHSHPHTYNETEALANDVFRFEKVLFQINNVIYSCS